MGNTAQFFESFVNVSHKVLGIELKPFSLNHYLWLEQLDSPLVNSSPCAMADLEVAVLICSQVTNEQIQDRLSASNLWRRMRRASWRKKNEKRDLTNSFNSFIAYQNDYLALPRFAPPSGETEEKLPWLLVTASAVIRNTGWSEETVFQMPIGKVFWFASVFALLKNGETNVISDKAQGAEDALRTLYGLQ